MSFYYAFSFYSSANSTNGRYFAHRAAYGTANSISTEKGTDGKKNNTSEYNHEYYMKNKEKWKDNNSSGSSSSEDEKEFDVDAAAWDVIRGRYGNGEERRKALGNDYEMVQKRVNELWSNKSSPQNSSVSNQSSNSNSESNDSEKRTFEKVKKEYYDNKTSSVVVEKLTKKFGDIPFRKLE